MKYSHQTIVCIDDNDQEVKEYAGIRDAMKRLQLSHRIVKSLCEQKIPQYNGYRLRYKDPIFTSNAPLCDDQGWKQLYHPITDEPIKGYFIHVDGYIKTPQNNVIQGEKVGNCRYKRIDTRRFKMSDLWKVSIREREPT